MGMDSHFKRAGLEGPFNPSYSVFLSFSKPHLEFRAEGGWWFLMLKGCARECQSEISYILNCRMGREQIRGLRPSWLTLEMCCRLVSLTSASTSSLFWSQLAQPALLPMVCESISSCATSWVSFLVVSNSNALHHSCPQEHTSISYLFFFPHWNHSSLKHTCLWPRIS